MSNPIELKKGADNKFFDLLINLHKPFLGSGFKNVSNVYTIYSKSNYAHPIGIVAIKHTGSGADFIEIALIPEAQGKGYSSLIIEKLTSLHPEIKKIGWTAHKKNVPSMKVLKKLQGGFFKNTVNNKGRKEAEGFFRVGDKAPKSMQEALDKQIQLSEPAFRDWTKEYNTRTKDIKRLRRYLDEHNKK